MPDVRTVSDKTDVASNSSSDSASEARNETQNLMKSGETPTFSARLDANWPDSALLLADAGTTTGLSAADPGDRSKNAKQKDSATPKGSDSKKCEGTKDFQTLIETTAAFLYEPKALGDLKTLMGKNACVTSTAEAVRLADEALKVVQDPFTDVLPKDEADERRIASEGHLTGVGVQIIRNPFGPGQPPAKEGPVVIQRVYANSPAELAGVKSGDVITSVGGVDISKMSTDDIAIKLLRGAEGTNVSLNVLRDGNPQTFDLKRAEYSFPAVTDQKMGDFAYIRMEDFDQDDAAEELLTALEKHQDAKGFVLDLRNNPGGQVVNAILSASLIMEKGEVFKVRQRLESDPANPEYAEERYHLTPNGIKTTTENINEQIGSQEDLRMPDLVHKPLVVLTNEGTASAAELLAGALQDNKEAILIGNTTFGKGIGQRVMSDMPGGSTLSVTNFRFFTPSGKWIGDGHNNRIGITPDIKVTMPDSVQLGSKADAQLNIGLQKLEELTGK